MRPWLALSAYASGDLETARAAAEGAVRIGRGSGDRWDEVNGEWLLGVLAQKPAASRRRASTSGGQPLTVHRPATALPAGSVVGLAELAKEDEDLAKAWELPHDGLELLDDYGDRVGSAAALETIADLTAALGEPERSLRLLAASQRFHTDTGIARFPPDVPDLPSAAPLIQVFRAGWCGRAGYARGRNMGRRRVCCGSPVD
ncbi:MAG: hypothetical protein ACRDLA_06490 [Thermoleophilaceae bacterium]